MAAKIIVAGYRTKAVPGIEKFLPEFKPITHVRDQSVVAEDLASKKAAFLAAAKDMPYAGFLDEVFLIDKSVNKIMHWNNKVAEGETRPPVAVRVRNYLTKHHGAAWDEDPAVRKGNEVVFVGFDPRTFLKLLGLECSLPRNHPPAPPRLWYNTSDHRDVGEAVMPREFKGLTLPYVLKHRRPVDPDTAKLWDEWTADWPGPGAFPERDAKISAELAVQLRLIVKDLPSDEPDRP